MLQKIKNGWEWVQDLLDVSGDSIMAVFTGVLIFRLMYTALGHAAITPAEAMAYSSAIAAFGYSNKLKP